MTKAVQRCGRGYVTLVEWRRRDRRPGVIYTNIDSAQRPGRDWDDVRIVCRRRYAAPVFRHRAAIRRPTFRRATMLRGFGQAEEIVEEVIEAPAPSGQRSVWPTVIAVGAVGFLGLGLLYGMSKASGPGAVGWGGF